MRLSALAAPPLLALALAASAAPEPEAAREVIEYYFEGDDVLLADARLCDRVDDAGPMVHACQEPRSDFTIKSGEPTYLWLMFMVPDRLEPQSIVIQFTHADTTFLVQRATITSSLRYRLWKKIRFDAPGEWTIRVIHEHDDNLEILKELTAQVQAPAQ